jgi:hypothetical protein
VRPQKISYELIERICANLAEGYTFDKAALNNGISTSTFFNWKKLGTLAESEQIFKDFTIRVNESVHFYEDEALQIIRSAAVVGRSWKAAAWLLENTIPTKYGKKNERGLAKGV